MVEVEEVYIGIGLVIFALAISIFGLKVNLSKSLYLSMAVAAIAAFFWWLIDSDSGYFVRTAGAFTVAYLVSNLLIKRSTVIRG